MFFLICAHTLERKTKKMDWHEKAVFCLLCKDLSKANACERGREPGASWEIYETEREGRLRGNILGGIL